MTKALPRTTCAFVLGDLAEADEDEYLPGPEEID